MKIINSAGLACEGSINEMVTLEDGSEAELVIHATDEGLVFDVWQNDECIKSAYMFVDDILAMCH